MKINIKEEIKKIDEQIQILYIKKNKLINLNNKTDEKKNEKPLKYSDYLLSYVI